jgi:hypothetical protein
MITRTRCRALAAGASFDIVARTAEREQKEHLKMSEHDYRCQNCGSRDDGLCLGRPRNEQALWTHAFYDLDYQRDQTRRIAIFDRVVDFLTSIGCRVKWTAGHDGSDNDFEYGVHISGVSYKGIEYMHNPCYRVHCELPDELLEKLDIKFGTAEGTTAI